MNAKLISALAWAGIVVVILVTMGHVWFHWSDTVVVGFGGIDACLQMGLLEWSAQHWCEPSIWRNLPIFYPLTGSIGYMDSLLGQALMVLPARWLLHPTMPAQYNLAYLLSLLLAALAMASLWWASGGPRWAAGPAALALLGAPYTFTQIPHLNQLPPPFVLFSLAALIAALRRQEQGQSAWVLWWLLAFSLVMQAAWGWYGFSYAVLGVAVVLITWLIHWIKSPEAALPPLLSAVRAGLAPCILAIIGVLLLAHPLLNIKARHPQFTRTEHEVTMGSADLKHFMNRGVYRSGPADWLGHGKAPAVRHLNRDRQTLHPGWVVLFLAPVGWWRRRHLAPQQQRIGQALLILGIVGLILAFGDSVGLPFTDRRFPLPLEGLRKVIPAFTAFRGVWRFAWLAVIAASWWSAVGIVQLREIYSRSKRGSLLAPGAMVLMTLLAIPAGVPAMKMDFLRACGDAAPAVDGPVLTLPAPENEYAEDVVEASWLLRALELGQPVTGGATGWVPPEIVAFRTRLKDCEEGRADPARLLMEMKAQGVVAAEIVQRPGDESRTRFWSQTLKDQGARAIVVAPRIGYRTYRLR